MFGWFLHFREIWLISLKNFVLHKSSIDSISVSAQVCLITQETKIQKSGRQQPVPREPRGSVLAVGQLTCPFPGPCIKVNGLSLDFIYCQSCSSKTSSPSVDWISLSPSSPHQPFFLRSRKVPQHVENTEIFLYWLDSSIFLSEH